MRPFRGNQSRRGIRRYHGRPAGYVLCQSRTSDYSWLAMGDFAMKKALEQGIVTANTCGKTTVLPKPGEVIIFARPLSSWERLKE